MQGKTPPVVELIHKLVANYPLKIISQRRRDYLRTLWMNPEITAAIANPTAPTIPTIIRINKSVGSASPRYWINAPKPAPASFINSQTPVVEFAGHVIETISSTSQCFNIKNNLSIYKCYDEKMTD